MNGRQLLIMGGGVIGLSIAWEGLRRGLEVVVIDRNDLPGRASLAGAGILAPGNAVHSLHPVDRMMGQSLDLHRKWSEALLGETGISNGLIECGGVYLALTPGEVSSLAAQASLWREESIEVRPLDQTELGRILGTDFSNATLPLAAFFVSAEMQIDNQAHLRSLAAAVIERGGVIERVDHSTPLKLEYHRCDEPRFVKSISIGNRKFECDFFCLAAGAWSGLVAGQAGLRMPTVPVRGQMLKFKLPSRQFVPVVNVGSRYIVPRADGHVLVGSTMEEAGFDATTTASAISELLELAESIFPELNGRTLVDSWAGLRPASFDGMPCVGFFPGFVNLLVASGHLRSGLQLSTATAGMICDLIEGRKVDSGLQKLLSPSRLVGTDGRMGTGQHQPG